MVRTQSIVSVSAVLVVLMAGCAGLVPTTSSPTQAENTPTPQKVSPSPESASASSVTAGQTQSSQPTSSSASGSDSSQATSVSTTGRSEQPSGAVSYQNLYETTIDSVVEITVRTSRGQSQGSGFVYSESGYIVTNQHVVGRADQVNVRFQTGDWRRARVVGTDVYTDLAVLQVDSLPAGIDPLSVAQSDPQPGQRVVALGSPFGYEGSITQGIVSGLNRSMQTAQGFSIPDTIQTDAPINPGNSGGPLVSLNGTVLGVNRAKQGDNIGFAISADVVRRVVPALIETGTYRHSFVGIRTVPVTPQIARATDLSAARGVMVVGVLADGPAAGVLKPADLRTTEGGTTIPVGGDVIMRIDGTPVRSQQALAQYLLLHTSPGDRVSLTVLRDGDRVTETLRLGQRPELTVNAPV